MEKTLQISVFETLEVSPKGKKPRWVISKPKLYINKIWVPDEASDSTGFVIPNAGRAPCDRTACIYNFQVALA